MSAELLRFPSPRATLPVSLAVVEPGLRVDTIDDPARFAALRDPWNELLESSSSNTVFLTWEWLSTWCAHLSAGTKLHVITVRRGSQILAIAPFVSRGTSLLGALRLSFIGTGRVGSDYLDILVRHGAAAEAIAKLSAHLVQTDAQLDLAQVRVTASAARLLARDLRLSGGLVGATRTHRCPYIDLKGLTFDSYLASLGSEHRYNFQRKLRKLETAHAMRFEPVDSEARRRELLPVLFELHRLRWSERGGSDGLSGEGIRGFHEEWSRLALSRGWLRFFILWLKDTPAAAFYGFRYGRVFSFYQSGFDPRFSKLSVGLVTMGLAIRSALDEGAAEFDLLHGEESYKLHWAKRSRRLFRLSVFPGGGLGHLARAGASARESARRLMRRLPARLVSRLTAQRRGGAQ